MMKGRKEAWQKFLTKLFPKAVRRASKKQEKSKGAGAGGEKKTSNRILQAPH